MNKDQARELLLEACDGGVATVRTPIVDDPEDTPCVVVGRASHDLLNESIKGCDASVFFATAKDPRGQVFPNYENGCSFFHTTGFEIAARGLAGQPEEAYAAFDRVMRHGYARNRLWAAALKWDTGELISEPLNNALLILWGFARGCLGVWPTLEECTIRGKPSPRLEGARYTFCHLGRDVTVEVRNGQTKVVSHD